jgi:hypothetical protein
LKATGGVNAHLNVAALVAVMVAEADCIDDMDLLRHGGMNRLFTGVRAPSTLGTFLRTFTFGHVRQLDAVAFRFLINLAKNAPILPGADHGAYPDVDDIIKAPHGYGKQGAGYGYTGVKGLNVARDRAYPLVGAGGLRDRVASWRHELGPPWWARFSNTARMNPTIVKAISGIAQSAWVPIDYPNAIWDEDEQRLGL